jgi:signal transduction histidine kinase
MKIISVIGALPRAVIMLIAAAGITAVYLLDYMTGTEISFSIFYLIPISVAVWYLGTWEGIAASVVSAVLWFIGDARAYSNDTIPLWNALVRFGFFSAIVVLLGYINKLNQSLEEVIKERTSELTKEISEKKKAEEEIKAKNQQLSQLAMNIQKVKEEENIRIAREVHDELGQMLTALKIEVSWFNGKLPDDSRAQEKLASIINLLDETLKTVRKISTHLRPRLLDELGLLPAIKMQVREFQTRTGIRCKLNLPEDTNGSIDKTISLAVFKIFQEAMTNISRHANATHVDINCKLKPGMLMLEVKDNGVGIYKNYPVDENSLGILGMKERAALINGEVLLQGLPEGGTYVKVSIPLINNGK